MKTKRLIVLMMVLSVYDAFSQSEKSKPGIGSFYITWGYNRDSYSRSTARFIDHKTDNYDFKLYHAKAKDQPDMDDLLRRPLTVPQYVFNLGYFFPKKKNWGIEVSWDHLKYVVKDYQTMHLKGDIRGRHFDQDTLVTPAFVHLEHTNGNNYLMTSVVRRYTLATSTNLWNRLSIITKGGAGALIPKTDSYIMGNHNDGPFRISGYVVALSAGFRFEKFRYLFIEGSLKGAFAHYTGAKLYESGRVRQRFFSAELIGAIGFNIPL